MDLDAVRKRLADNQRQLSGSTDTADPAGNQTTPVVDATVMDVNDYESQRWLGTKTVSNTEWDLCIGLSQRAINKQLEELFKMYPEMSEMYSTDNEAGFIDAKLLAPRILVIGGTKAERSKLLFQLRFESGRMQNSDGVPVVEDLSGWIISSLIQIDANTQGDDKAKSDKTKKWLANANVPGDYSIERLYFKLSTIPWHDFDKDNTYCGLDKSGNPVPFKQWESEESGRSLRLSNWISAWASQQDAAGRNIIGLSFGAFQDDNPPKPFYATTPTTSINPLFQSLQSYPYLSNLQSAPEGGTGFDGAGACNALVYTEMVGQASQPSPDSTLAWSGNFTSQGPPPDNSGLADGTIVIGRDLLFQQVILPRLVKVNRGKSIFPTISQDWEKNEEFSMNVSVEDAKYVFPGKEKFQFTLGTDNSYSWKTVYEDSAKKNYTGTMAQGGDGGIQGSLEGDLAAAMNRGIQGSLEGALAAALNGGIMTQANVVVEDGISTETSASILLQTEDEITYLRKWYIDRSHKVTKEGSGNSSVVQTANNYTVDFKVGLVASVNITQANDLDGVIGFQISGFNPSAHFDWSITPSNRKIQPEIQDELNGNILKEIKKHYTERVDEVFSVDWSWDLRACVFDRAGRWEAMRGNNAGIVLPINYKALKKIDGYFLPRPPKTGVPGDSGQSGGKNSGTDNPAGNGTGNPDGSTSGSGGGGVDGGSSGNDGSGGGGGGGSNASSSGLSWTPIDPKVTLKRDKILLHGTLNSGESKIKQIGIDFTSGQRGYNVFEEDKWTLEKDDGGGVIRLRAQLSQGETVSLAPIRTLGSKRLLTLGSAKGNDSFKMQTGDWVEIELEGIIGGAHAYTININEITDATTPEHHKTPMTVTVNQS